MKTLLIAIIALVAISFYACKKDAPSEQSDTILPTITAISPTSGHFGTVLTITGTGFSAAGRYTVEINGVKAEIKQITTDSITVIVPTTNTGNVVIKQGNDVVTGPVFQYTTDVIVAGFQQKTTGGYLTIATYWYNGVLTKLTNGSRNAQAFAVASKGKDVYVVGYESVTANSMATVWKNNVAIHLTDGTHSAIARCIVISGDDVYVGGSEFDGTKDVAKVWKNGVATTLTNGVANAIAISGTDVYAAGVELIPQGAIAKVWKNGVETNISNGNYYSVAYGIAVSGNDVHVAGFQMTPYEAVATYWKNNVPQQLPYNYHDGHATAIALSGQDVYMTGYLTDSYTHQNKGVVWKNGWVDKLITDAAYNELYAIAITGNDIYTAGSAKGNDWVAKYWKNDEATVLTGDSLTSIPYGICIR